MKPSATTPALAALLACGTAWADVQLEQFEPQPAGSGLMGVQTPRLLPDGGLSLSLWSSLADSPLRLEAAAPDDTRADRAVVEQSLRFELVAAYGVFDGVELSAALPFALGFGPGEVSIAGRSADDLAGAGLGDVRVGLTLEPGRLLGGPSLAERWGVGLGLGLTAWLPTGDTGRLEGEGELRYEPRLLVAIGEGRWRAAADVGWHVRSETRLFTFVNGDQIKWRVGVSAPTPLAALDLEASVFAGHHLEAQPDPLNVARRVDTRDYDPVEALGAVRWQAAEGLEVRVGGGGGLSDGLGAPAWRAIAGVGWALPAEGLGPSGEPDDPDGDGVGLADVCPLDPEVPDGVRDEDGCPEAAQVGPVPRLVAGAGPLPDADGDRVPDEIDLCPAEPEDRDGFADGDGCPDVDDDGDGVLDGADRCPAVAETPNGFEDADGCPDVGPDRDGDGIGDAHDRCPADPELKNGVRDWDGCPEGVGGRGEPEGGPVAGVEALPPLPRAGDADGDGVPDADDLCLADPEDGDGFEDGDGCPEDDPDGDGVADGVDRCPALAETVNGFEDGDGCPDVGPDGDGDGVEDVYDVCPREPEDADGLRDGDGCPEWVPDDGGPPLVAALDVLAPLVPAGDPDGDGLSGDADRCPTVAEDVDGFEDGDGCPEADDDGDGVLDAFDGCRREAETPNFFNDADGCPDLAPRQVAGIIGAVESIQFKVGRSDLRPGAFPVLRRVARAMARYPRLRLQIDGHTDSTGERARNFELSNDRAASVRAWLIGQGIDARRLSSFGYGPDRPVASNRDLQGRYRNRRVELSYTEPGSPSPKGDPP